MTVSEPLQLCLQSLLRMGVLDILGWNFKMKKMHISIHQVGVCCNRHEAWETSDWRD